MVLKIGVLASGGGSNLQAILDAIDAGTIRGAEVAVVVSDKKDAFALERARKKGIDAVYIEPSDHKSREDFDAAMAKELSKKGVGLVLLAGYMRIVTPKFLKILPCKVMNIHPALLPSFAGLHAQKQALEYGVKVSGCTVHFVDSEVDHGPIIAQQQVPVLEGDTEQTLSARILGQEHIIYPQAVKLFVEGKLKLEGRRVKVM